MASDDDYDAEDDVWKSYAVALQAIRERMAAGGQPYVPKDHCPECPVHAKTSQAA
jgi:hypothetical protein